MCGLDVGTPMKVRLDICELHFRRPQDYKPDSNRLYPGVVPTQNLPLEARWKLEGPPVVQFPEEGEVVSLLVDPDNVLSDDPSSEEVVFEMEIDVDKGKEDWGHTADDFVIASNDERSISGSEADQEESDFELGSEDFLESSDEEEEEEGAPIPSESLVEKDLIIAQLTRKLKNAKVRKKSIRLPK